MNTVGQIQDNLREGMYAGDPNACARDSAVLSGHYAYISDKLSAILQAKPAIWNQMRSSSGIKSDTACERVWQATEMGIEETKYKLQLKSLEKQMAALRALLQLYQTEARNIT